MPIAITSSTLFFLSFLQPVTMLGINKSANKPIPSDIGKNSRIYFRSKSQEYCSATTFKRAPDSMVENRMATTKKR